jgi:hypothetical protein
MVTIDTELVTLDGYAVPTGTLPLRAAVRTE